jgi:hypothetical protein
MRAYRFGLTVIAPLLFVLSGIGCSSTKTITVAVPPRMDLKPYPVVGLVAFTSNANSDLEQLATQKFLHAVQSAQPGTRVVELGSEQNVLGSVDRRSWDTQAVRAIKEKHGVDVVVVGRLEMAKAKPQVNVSAASVWKSVSARSDVNVLMSAKLMETGSGATMWTNSANATANVAHGSFDNHGGGFGVRDPETVYGGMIEDLACRITEDFRMHYVQRRVPKDAPEVASAND